MSFNLKIADQINYNVDGLVAQQHDTGEVLMLAWMNKESLIKTLETNNIYYWSRSRNKKR
jgi:phosphoribosyl-AMP cyclohydrolase